MYSRIGEFLLQRFDELGGEFLAVLLGRLELVGDAPVLLGFGEAEVDVFHFAFHVVESQLVGQRDIEHQGLKDLPFLRSLGEHLEVSHHFEAVRYLEDGDPGIGGILDDEFLVVLRFQTGVLWLDRRDLVKSVHHCDNVMGESRKIVFVVGIQPSGFVKEHGGDTFGLQSDFVRDDEGHVGRMFHERMAVVPCLSVKRLGCDVV